MKLFKGIAKMFTRKAEMQKEVAIADLVQESEKILKKITYIPAPTMSEDKPIFHMSRDTKLRLIRAGKWHGAKGKSKREQTEAK